MKKRDEIMEFILPKDAIVIYPKGKKPEIGDKMRITRLPDTHIKGAKKPIETYTMEVLDAEK